MAEIKKPVSAELTSEQVKSIKEVCQQLNKVKGKVLPILACRAKYLRQLAPS